jgi:protein involved in polysaccharide export with SLBB domain
MITKLMTAIAIIGLSLLSVSAQTNSNGSTHQAELLSKGPTIGNRARVVGRLTGGERSEQQPESSVKQLVASGKAEIPSFSYPGSDSANDAPATKPTSGTGVVASASVPSANLGQEYRVGVGDVLDVQLTDLPTRKSTLFTVRDGGALDYPLAGDPLVVAGLTAEEIAFRLRSRIKVLANPIVSVKVRDYLSHSVIITGLVTDPGARFLRREAMPLYVVLAEAQPRPEALTATITRPRQPAINIDLFDHQAMSTLVMPGDLIKIVGPPKEVPLFFYAGGALNQPGQKVFHSGLTLTQAILASGGNTREAGSKARIARQGTDGRLNTVEYNLRQIQDGKAADPILQSGDRITVGDNR